ncbi:hypothetical protein FRC12_019963 [Ceratobasidium sp. 428]|nr:hypothetical protein FRC12_019963 [Ceratobasidium sp. 428]
MSSNQGWNTKYELPPVIKSVQAGWLASFQSSATVAALLAAVESQLFTFVKGLSDKDPIDLNSRGYRALVTLTYASFFFSVSATVSSLVLSDQFGELGFNAAVKVGHLEEPTSGSHDSLHEVLTRHGLSRATRPVKWHWIFMLILGYLCLVAQLLVYVSLAEPMDVRIAVYCLTGFSMFPIISLLS